MSVVLFASLFLEMAFDLVVDDVLRHGDFRLLQQKVEQSLARLGAVVEHRALFDLSLHVVAQFLDRVELARHLGELVVRLGNLADLHLIDGDFDFGFFALVVAADQGRLEGRGLAGGQSFDGLVESLDEVTRTDLVRDRRGGVDGLAANGRGEVHDDEVALRRRTLNRDERSETRADGEKFLVDLGVGDGRGLNRHLERVVFGHCYLGTNVRLDSEHEVTREVLVRRKFGVDDFGTAECADLFRLGRHAEEAVDAFAHRVVDDLLAADPLVDELRRNLALAETLDLDLLGDVLVGVVNRRLQLGRGDRDLQLDPRIRQGLDDGGRHSVTPR